ncbi:MAG: DNA methyltransferase [Stagnimonas sp.]|nr:DNA methyltransferase [Stagnimonas sp.]
MTDQYRQFLEAKVLFDHRHGFEIDPSEVNPILKPHQAAIVVWAVLMGGAGLFEAFGLGKSVQQLEILRLILKHSGGQRALICAPLGVRQEFKRDAEMLGLTIRFVRRSEEVDEPGLYLTNYESIRDGRLDPSLFDAASLDEGDCLRGFGGSKTFREFMRHFEHNAKLRFRFVATATPSPNEYIELLAYAAFLEVMDVGQAKTRFFKRNSEKADELTLHPHKEQEFWLWVNTWAIFLQRPSDLGFSDEGYDLPPMEVIWHELPVDHTGAGTEKDGQARLFRNAAIGVQDAAREKRDSLPARIEKLMEIRALHPEAHRIIWHDLEAERAAIEAAVPGAISVYGSQDLDKREQAVIDFSEGRFQELAAKPTVAGSGCNFQRHCHQAVFLGIGFKFKDLIQAIHRIQRFLQKHGVRIDLIYTEAEREVRRNLERKWRQHMEQTEKMSEIIRTYGLNQKAMIETLTRTIGCQRVEDRGEQYVMVNNDTVVETRSMEADSIDLIVTSIPFAHQYEYTPSYNDFGHTDDNAHFWAQMDFLIPELYRVLKPGRVACIHVKDRITPSGISGMGFQVVTPFSDECTAAFRRHGFGFLSRVTVVTDVVRENNQTYRLGWSEQCKDGTRMGNGMPEYLLKFRKPPTDRSNGYADVPVVKLQPDCLDADGNRVPYQSKRPIAHPIEAGRYTRPRWQYDAHGFHRSSGNRPLRPEELAGLPQDVIFKMFRDHSLSNVYDFHHDVRLAEAVEMSGWLPSTFMLLQPQSWHEEVWTDITRMLTLNSAQSAKGKEMHLCPLQFDLVDRCIEQHSMPDELVYDPFAGLGTVPVRAIKLGRRGRGTELNPRYWFDSCAYCKAEEKKRSMPDLFEVLEQAA